MSFEKSVRELISIGHRMIEMKYILTYIDIMGFEKRAKNDAEKTGLSAEDMRDSYQKIIERRLDILKTEKVIRDFQRISLDSWLLTSDDFGSVLKSVEKILKANLPLEIVIDVKKFNKNVEEELIAYSDEAMALYKSGIIKQYKDEYIKINKKPPVNTYILFTDDANEEFDSERINELKRLVEENKVEASRPEISLDTKTYDWDCKKIIFTVDEQDIVKTYPKKNVIVTIEPSQSAYIKIPTTRPYGIKLTLKDLNGIELPEETRITLWKEKIHNFDGLLPIGKYLEDCTYGDLRKKYTPENEILLSSNEFECLALYFKGQEQKIIDQKVIVEDIQPQFTVNLCTKRR